MYGWRARIMSLHPVAIRSFTNSTRFPEGFMMLNTTGTVRQLVDDDFEKQLHRIEEASDVKLLEDEIGKPVPTSSLACMGYAMKMIDIKENVAGFDRLMASL